MSPIFEYLLGMLAIPVTPAPSFSGTSHVCIFEVILAVTVLKMYTNALFTVCFVGQFFYASHKRSLILSSFIFCTKAEITKLIALFLLVPISASGKVRLVRLSCSCVHQR